MTVHSFRHRQYWYLGREREKKWLLAMYRLVGPSDTVFDIGGHIGYTALFFSWLATEGSVHVFEPGPNNRPYLERNVRERRNVTVVNEGVGKTVGSATLYMEDLSGQNNSFVEQFDGLAETQALAFVAPEVSPIDVPITTIDDYSQRTGVYPSFLKIDVEGFELPVLLGAKHTLENHRPAMLLEVQKDRSEIFDYMTACGYLALNERFEVISKSGDMKLYNVFLHAQQHRWAIDHFSPNVPSEK